MTDNKKQDSTQFAPQQKQDDDTPPVGVPDAAIPEDSFPERLVVLREEKGLKHDSLSELTKYVDPQKRGIARTTLRGYELGVTKPGIRELRILSQALGVSTNRLIFGTDTIESTSILGAYSSEPKTVLNCKQEDIVGLACFVVSLYRLGDQERDTVYRVASSLAAAKLGEVEYRKLMDGTREIVEIFIDAHSDALIGGKQFSENQIKDMLFPLIKPIFEKFGFEPTPPPV